MSLYVCLLLNPHYKLLCGTVQTKLMLNKHDIMLQFNVGENVSAQEIIFYIIYTIIYNIRGDIYFMILFTASII